MSPSETLTLRFIGRVQVYRYPTVSTPNSTVSSICHYEGWWCGVTGGQGRDRSEKWRWEVRWRRLGRTRVTESGQYLW